MKSFLLVSLVLFLGACTHLQSVSTTPVPANRSKMVQAEGSRFMFMLFNFDNKYVDNMVMDLAQQCPGGKVEGLLTKYEVTTYFPLFAYNLKATANGYCVAKSK